MGFKLFIASAKYPLKSKNHAESKRIDRFTPCIALANLK